MCPGTTLVLLLQQSSFDMGNSVDMAAVAASDSLLLPDEDKSPHPSEFFNEQYLVGVSAFILRSCRGATTAAVKDE